MRGNREADLSRNKCLGENKMNKIYIVLFRDGSMQFFNNKRSVQQDNYQTGSMCFEVFGNLTLLDLMDWIECAYEGWRRDQINQIW